MRWLAACRPRCLQLAPAKQAAQLLYTAWALGWVHKDLHGDAHNIGQDKQWQTPTGQVDLSGTFMQTLAKERLVPVLLNLCSLAALREVVVDEGVWQSLVDASPEQPKRRMRKTASKQVCALALGCPMSMSTPIQC